MEGQTRGRRVNRGEAGKSQSTVKQGGESAAKRESYIRQRLKKELSTKFSKNIRRDEINQTTLMGRNRSSHSLLAHNPLTKSTFSITDTITHKSALKSILIAPRSTSNSVLPSRKQVASFYRQRYSNPDSSQFFPTKAEVPFRQPILKPTLSAREIINRSTPSLSFSANLQARNNKFKLLFREKNSQLKTASQRKISRIDSKISVLQEKKIYLKSLMPKEKAKVVVNRPKPRGEVVKKEKIMSLALTLIRYIELYFNMYQHDNIVGGHFKNIEGYSAKIKNIIMADQTRARRITHIEDITNFFWSFRPAGERPLYFGEEDLALYNILNGYIFKIQKKYTQTLANFSRFQVHKRKAQKSIAEQSKDKYESKQGKHPQIDKINKFIEDRVRYDQGVREEYMSGLEKRGVTLNIIERSRQTILREKELAMKLSLKHPKAK